MKGIMNNELRIRILQGIILYSLFTILYSPPAFAADPPKPTEYKLLAPLPNIETSPGSGKATASTFIPGLFKLMIGIATALAVLTIMFGGVKYISTAGAEGKSDARKTIENALWGLILALAAWLILFTINPKLVEFNLNITPQEIRSAPVVPPSGGAVCSNCVTFDSLKIPTSGDANGKSIAPYFGEKLSLLNSGLQYNGITWTVTEGYPPSVTHKSVCHNIGTCVDANISSANAANINKFVSVASGIGLGASYEVKTAEAKQDLVRAGVYAFAIVVNPKATAPHFHIR